MSSVAGIAFAACALLLVGAAAKVADPAPLATALRRLGLPHRRRLVRTISISEAALAVTAATTGWRAAWLAVAASYLVFTGFVLLVRRRGGALASCGCFGGVDTPATRLHVLVTAGYAVVAVAAGAVTTPPSLTGAAPAVDTLLVLAAALCVAYLSYVTVTLLPRVRALSTSRG